MQTHAGLNASAIILAVVLTGLSAGHAAAQTPREPSGKEPSGRTPRWSGRKSAELPTYQKGTVPDQPSVGARSDENRGSPQVRPAANRPADSKPETGGTLTAIRRALSAVWAGESATAAAAAPAAASTPAAEPKLRFQFRYQPWKDVLDWFAQQAGLSLVMDAPPPGTFNYSDDRQYTPAEAIDLLNSVLLTKGYTLVRRGRMLIVVNLEDGIPPNLVTTVPAEALDSKGEYELVSTLFTLEKISPEEAEAEIKKLIGPQGSVVSLPKSRQVLITETAGRLRAIRAVLARIESPEGHPTGRVETFSLAFAAPEAVVPVARQMLGIPEDKPSAADGSIRVAVEPGTNRIVASGSPEKVARVQQIVKALDVAAPGQTGSRVEGTPQLEVYTVTGSDPQAVLAVLQTLLTGLPDVRLAVDPKTGNLIAMARPAQQATIRATLAQLQREAQRVEVIRLVRVDPQTAVLAITKLFGAAEAGKTTAPQVDADPITRQLLIRGTEPQIVQIRSLLEKMGESGSAASTGGEKVRVLPLSSRNSRAALERIQEIWPTMRANKIRVVAPSAPAEPPGSTPGEPREKPAPPPGVKPQAAEKHGGARIVLVAAPGNPADSKGDSAKPQAAAAAEPAPIFVIPGPNGLIIASEDTAALDEFERLLGTLTGGAQSGWDTTIFYLTHAKASQAAETLERLFGGGAATVAALTPSGPPPGLPGQPGGAAGNVSLLGTMLQMGTRQRTMASGPIRITPDERLNALIVQANAADLDAIEQMVRVLDQKEGPEEVLITPKPRLIPVLHKEAQEIADIVREVYADRMVQAPQQRGPMGGPFAAMMAGAMNAQMAGAMGGQ
ncbi:MAG: secretin N-terminal domain-containing protein, partial [Thermoguttaceae bacterium]